MSIEKITSATIDEAAAESEQILNVADIRAAELSENSRSV